MSRETALRVLINCRTRGAWADAALQSQIDRDGLDRQDAALCSRIVYGVLQNQDLLDFYLRAYCSQRLDHLQPPLAEILRIGAYQILFLDKVPDSAAVNTSVELAKRFKPDSAAVNTSVELAKRFKRAQAAGLVNAVLRKLSRSKADLPSIPDRDDVKYLSIRYSHPKWLVKRLLPLLGREETEAFLAANNAPAPITAQVNTYRYTTEHVAGALTAAGVEAEEDPGLPDCLILSGTGGLEGLEAFRAGAFYIQDPAARMAVLAAGVKRGGLLHSGPGGPDGGPGCRREAGGPGAGRVRRPRRKVLCRRHRHGEPGDHPLLRPPRE